MVPQRHKANFRTMQTKHVSSLNVRGSLSVHIIIKPLWFCCTVAVCLMGGFSANPFQTGRFPNISLHEIAAFDWFATLWCNWLVWMV